MMKLFSQMEILKINNEVSIIAEKFNYNKNLNILKANQNVKFEDNIQELIIYADDVTYKKTSEVIFTKVRQKLIYKTNINLFLQMLF